MCMCVRTCVRACAWRMKPAGLSSAVGLLSCELKIRNSRPFALNNVSEQKSGALPSPEPPGEWKNLLGQGSCFSITRLQSSMKCCHAVGRGNKESPAVANSDSACNSVIRFASSFLTGYRSRPLSGDTLVLER